MSQFQLSIAATSAGLGVDLAANEAWKRRGFWRFLNGLALKGSAAANDTEIEAFVGEERVGNFYNTNTGFPNRDDVQPVGRWIPPNEELRLVVIDAPATNPINCLVDLVP